MNLKIFKTTDIGKLIPTPTGFGKQWLKPILLKTTDNSVRLMFHVSERMLDHNEDLPSGLILAIMDEIIGITAYGFGKQLFSTNLKVDFIFSSNKPSKIIAESNILNEENGVLYLECRLYCDTVLLAKGVSHGIFR